MLREVGCVFTGVSVLEALRQLPTDDEQARQMPTEQLVALIKLAARLVSTQLSTETKVTQVEAEEMAGSFFTWLYKKNQEDVALWMPAEALMVSAAAMYVAYFSCLTTQASEHTQLC